MTKIKTDLKKICSKQLEQIEKLEKQLKIRNIITEKTLEENSKLRKQIGQGDNWEHD